MLTRVASPPVSDGTNTGRKGKQCRERWYNQLDPSINREPWTEEEERTLHAAHAQLGNRYVGCIGGRMGMCTLSARGGGEMGGEGKGRGH